MTIVEELATHMVHGEYQHSVMQRDAALRLGGAPQAAQAISQARAMAMDWCRDWQPVEEEPPKPPAHIAQVSYGRRRWADKYQVFVDGRVVAAVDDEADAKADAKCRAAELGGRYAGRVAIK